MSGLVSDLSGEVFKWVPNSKWKTKTVEMLSRYARLRNEKAMLMSLAFLGVDRVANVYKICDNETKCYILDSLCRRELTDKQLEGLIVDFLGVNCVEATKAMLNKIGLPSYHLLGEWLELAINKGCSKIAMMFYDIGVEIPVARYMPRSNHHFIIAHSSTSMADVCVKFDNRRGFMECLSNEKLYYVSMIIDIYRNKALGCAKACFDNYGKSLRTWVWDRMVMENKKDFFGLLLSQGIKVKGIKSPDVSYHASWWFGWEMILYWWDELNHCELLRGAASYNPSLVKKLVDSGSDHVNSVFGGGARSMLFLTKIGRSM